MTLIAFYLEMMEGPTREILAIHGVDMSAVIGTVWELTFIGMPITFADIMEALSMMMVEVPGALQTMKM